MPVVEYQTVNYYYIQNDYNRLSFNKQSGNGFNTQQTGWHYIPNSRFCDFLNPAQWFDLVTNHESARLIGVDCIVENLIPLTDQLAIQQTSTFVSFNNTIYALCYTDDCYETVAQSNKDATVRPIVMREGIVIATDGSISDKLYLPLYTHQIPDITHTLPGFPYFWDPFTRASKIQELRPGKNAVNFSFRTNPADQHIIWNLGAGTWTMPVKGKSSTEQQHPQHISTALDAYKAPLTPNNYSVGDTSLNQTAPTCGNINPACYNEHYTAANAIWATQNGFKYPIMNWFIKMVPIFDSNKALIKHEGQICVIRRISFEVTPRKSAVNMPRMDYHFADTQAMSDLVNATNPTFKMGVPKLTNRGYHTLPNGEVSNNTPHGWPDIFNASSTAFTDTTNTVTTKDSNTKTTTVKSSGSKKQKVFG